MADTPNIETSAAAPSYEDIAGAPFIYFDPAPTFGVLAGAIQIELASRILIPRTDGGVDTKFISTGRLRRSPAAADQLRDALNAALKCLSSLNKPQRQRVPS